MIKIIFPFANCAFIVDSSFSIESHVSEKFYLFTKFVEEIDDEFQGIVIIANKNKIKIHNKQTNKFYIIESGSDYDVFKKIISLIRDNIVINGNVCILHASFIEIFKKNIVLLGKSGAGKSTLAAYLHLVPGGKCYTDDILYVNYESMVAQGVPQYMNLRPSSLNLLPTDSNTVYDDFIERYKLKAHPCIEQKIDYIVFLDRREEIEANIKIINTPIGLLAQSMYLPYSLRNNIIAANKLAINSPVYEMCFSDLYSAYNLLKKLGE